MVKTYNNYEHTTMKTEICIFHRRNCITRQLNLMGQLVESQNVMNLLGMKFDSKMKWNEQVEMTIKSANTSLYGLRMIRKYFTNPEMKSMVTAIFMSRLYYGAEVPGPSVTLHKNIKFDSANALRLRAPNATLMITHIEIHCCVFRPFSTFFCSFQTFFNDFKPEIDKKHLKMKKNLSMKMVYLSNQFHKLKTAEKKYFDQLSGGGST